MLTLIYLVKLYLFSKCVSGKHANNYDSSISTFEKAIQLIFKKCIRIIILIINLWDFVQILTLFNNAFVLSNFS